VTAGTNILSRVVFLIQVSRPIIWPVLPLIYGLGMHSSHAPISAAAVVQMLLLTFPMNLVGCGLNDIYDYESDRRSSRRRAVWGALVGEGHRQLVLYAVLVMIPVIVLGAFLTRNWINVVATASLILIAWLYSAPPVRLKERPPFDSISNGLGYFLIPFVMGYSLAADPRYMPLRYYLLALCVCGVHALATAADYDADRAAGHKTMAVVFGRRKSAAVAFVAFFVTWVLADFQSGPVRVYIAVCTVATFVTAVLPRDRVFAGACVTIFVGFLIAAVFHMATR
jgi:4-hydroxybenzoate polyprenyltransferase